MADHNEIYKKHADKYDLLVSREDYKGNILSAIKEIISPEGMSSVESGAGTGRLTKLIIPLVSFITAFDISFHMLKEGEKKLRNTGFKNWKLAVADHRNIPLKTNRADFFISGWSLSYIIEQYPHCWKKEFHKVFAEIKRLVRPGGTAIILESLGTGRKTPEAPTKELANYYKYLEEDLDFSSRWIRTDYKFDTVEEAYGLVKMFFGDEAADNILKNKITILPECTGLWWRHF